MKLDIYDVDALIKLNNLPKIETTNLLNKEGRPVADGLYSYEIFGRPGSKDRRFQFAYVDLEKHFFHPVIFRMLTAMDRSIGEILSGTKYVTLNSKGMYEETEDEEKASTGIDFFYKNWDKIKWDARGSKSREANIRLLTSLKKNEVFCKSWVVCPPFYRDIDTSSQDTGVITKDELTTLYTQLLALTNVLKDHTDFYTSYITESKVQEKLYEIYDHFIKKLEKKKGLIRQAVLGKSVDYAVRAVISGPEVNAPTYDTQQVPYGYIGVPLHMAMSAFLPYVLMQMENFFSSFVRGSVVSFSSTDKTIEISEQAIGDISRDNVIKLIKLYSLSHEDRLATFKITSPDGVATPLSMYEEKLGRPFTVTDLFFLVTSEVVKDKHVLATRYPVEDFRNVAMQKVILLTTEKTIAHSFLSGEKVFNNYPLLAADKTKWVDSVRPNNAYLSAWGGDFDGLEI